jgi:glutathione S-transferase
MVKPWCLKRTTILQLGLFPHTWEGVQAILWRHIEKEVEGFAFKLNDIYFEENVPAKNRLDFIRYKERKFGAGCLQQWRQEQDHLLGQLTHGLAPYEQMLADKPYLLDASPRFVDFDLHGMLANFLYSGHLSLPAVHANVRSWYERMSRVTLKTARQAL